MTTRYGRAALRDECERVTTSREGTRNETLFRAAANIGELVAGGEVSEADAWDDLTRAADLTGLDDHEAYLTIRSGLRDRKPRGNRRAVESRIDRASGRCYDHYVAGKQYVAEHGTRAGGPECFCDIEAVIESWRDDGTNAVVAEEPVTPRPAWPSDALRRAVCSAQEQGDWGKAMALAATRPY